MRISSIRGMEAGDKAFPFWADPIEQALETRFVAQRLKQRVAVG